MEMSVIINQSPDSMESQILNGKKRIQEEKNQTSSKKQQLSSPSSFIGRSFPPPAIPSPFPTGGNYSTPNPSLPPSSPSNYSTLSKFPPPASIKNLSSEANHSVSSLPKPTQDQSRHQLFNQIWIWEQLIQREQSLLERFKSLSNLSSEKEGNALELESKLQQTQQEVRSFFEHKMKVLMPLISEPLESCSTPQPQSSYPPPLIPSNHQQQSSKLPAVVQKASSVQQSVPYIDIKSQSGMTPSLVISQHPSDVIIANRYIVPAPSVVVSIPKGYSGSVSFNGIQPVTLVLSASLLYHLSGKEVSKTMDGKQDILQGVKRISVDLNTMTAHSNSSHLTSVITFSKLKILEVSSKHKHQPFSIVFSIEEYIQGSKRIISTTRSSLFQVLSRPTSTHYGSPSPNATLTSSQNFQSGASKKPSLSPDSNNNNVKKDERSLINENDGNSSQDLKIQLEDNSNMILQDITELLTLPQKEAASKLGISESMLCKRFKESTRRKWPYRYLRKLEKVIKMLHLQEKEGGTSKEDREKLDRLEKEKEECLRPVKIRITANDRIASLNYNSSTNSSTSPRVEKEEKSANSGIPLEESSNDDDEDEMEGRDEDHFVLQTLEMLKTQRPC
eukprot:TRINITY_DN3399_c0_g1_i2.p1 TRINITY_DN3399_c0_g1~~TRINITY_DN3399_c0_g1_i2.p1  ORF type:complete len:617 (-),score=203.94 TRINITY_DN3399_c0_g1_i2:59-1909(-)